MQGNFYYHNPTKLYFGEDSLNFLKDELQGYGPNVLLNYGSGSCATTRKPWQHRSSTKATTGTSSG